MAPTTNSKPEAVADLTANDNDPHPSRKVFDVAELLERVLLRVPIQDLIAHAALVCKEWKQMIDTSPNLQKGLFLRSIAEPADGKKAVRVANPMIYQNTSKKGLAIKGDRWGPDPRYANRSWKSMFMCQPPLHEVYMTWIRRPSAPVIRSGLALRSLPGRPDHVIDPTGIKLGTYGASTTGQLARQRRFFGSDSDYLSSDVKSWKRAETPADVLQLLGVGGD